MLAKNQINRNKLDNMTKFNNKNLVLSYLYKTTSIDISSGNRIEVYRAFHHFGGGFCVNSGWQIQIFGGEGYDFK